MQAQNLKRIIKQYEKEIADLTTHIIRYCDEICDVHYRQEFKKRACLEIECPLYKHCPYKLTEADINHYRKEVKNGKAKKENQEVL